MNSIISIILIFVILRSDVRTEWILQTSNTTRNLRSVYFINADVGYAVGSSIVLKTTNGGVNWLVIQMFDSSIYLGSVVFTSNSIGYVGGGQLGGGGQYSSKIYKTTDAGNSWGELGIIGHKVISNLSFPNENTGYYGVSFCYHFLATTVFRTTNSGGSWQSIWDGYICSMTDLYFPNVNTGYYVGGNGSVLKSTNAGVNWNGQVSGTTVLLWSVFFVQADIGYIVDNGGTILKTTNGGLEWYSQISGTGNSLYDVFFTAINIGYAVGGSGVILKTTNGGLNWFNQISGTGNNLNSVFFVDESTGYTVGNSGIILKTTDGGISSISVNYGSVPKDFVLGQNYPNPFNPITNIRLDVPKAMFTKLILIDVLGREVATLVNQELKAGSYEVEWDGSSYTSGIYYYKLIAEGYSETKKMVLIK